LRKHHGMTELFNWVRSSGDKDLVAYAENLAASLRDEAGDARAADPGVAS
jgi:hypothetical protein